MKTFKEYLAEAAPQIKVPQIPQLPAQDGDQGDGSVVKTNPDGTKSYSGAFGTFIYDKTGKAITYNTPSMSGASQSINLATNQSTQNYNVGPVAVSGTTDASGKVTGTNAEYTMGTQKATMSTDAAGNKTTSMAAADPTKEVEEEQDDGRDLVDLAYGVLTGGKRRSDPNAPPGPGNTAQAAQAKPTAQPTDKKDQPPPAPSPSYLDKLKKLAGMN